MLAEKFEGELRDTLEAYARVYTMADQPGAARLRQLAPVRDIANAAPAIAKLRMAKSPEEIDLIQHATDVTLAAHRAAWQRAAPGLYEYQVAAAMTEAYADAGCERSASEPIVGSGPKSVYLLSSHTSRRIDEGA